MMSEGTYQFILGCYITIGAIVVVWGTCIVLSETWEWIKGVLNAKDN